MAGAFLLSELRRTRLLRGWVHKAECPSFVQSRYDVLCKHHSQRHRVAQSTNTTHNYSANPLRSCSSKTIASFCWNRTASGIVSQHRQLCKQTRSQVHCQSTRDQQRRHPNPLQHQSDSAPSLVLASSSSYLVACRIASYKATSVPLLGRGS